MTLKEKLNEKIKQDSVQSLWNEVESIFLSADYATLQKGVSMQIFKNCDNSPLFYILGYGSTGTKFSSDYDLDTVERMIPICEENGIDVNRINKNSFELKFVP